MRNRVSKSSINPSTSSSSEVHSPGSISFILNTLSPLLNLTLFFLLSGDLSSPNVRAVACFCPNSRSLVFRNLTRKSFLASNEPFEISSAIVRFRSIPISSSSSDASGTSVAIIDLARSLAHSVPNSAPSRLNRHLCTIFSSISSVNFCHSFFDLIVRRMFNASVVILTLSTMSLALGCAKSLLNKSVTILIPITYSFWMYVSNSLSSVKYRHASLSCVSLRDSFAILSTCCLQSLTPALLMEIFNASYEACQGRKTRRESSDSSLFLGMLFNVS